MHDMWQPGGCGFQEEVEIEDITFPNIFVTVGTTKFPELVELLLTDKLDEFVKQLVEWRTTRVIIQKGNTHLSTPKSFVREGIMFGVYDYKPSLAEDMEWADLIIAHAGAGTAIEAMELKKPIIIVPNPYLYENHQRELADKLGETHQAFVTSIWDFFKDVKELKKSWFLPPPTKNTKVLVKFLNEVVLGINETEWW